MHHDKLFESDGGGRAATQAYWNALRKLRNAWREVSGDELEATGSRGKEAFENAIEEVKRKLRDNADRREKLLNILDVSSQDEIVESLVKYADVDDLSPNHIKQVMIDECLKRGNVKIKLSLFLRSVLDDLFDSTEVRRPKVGPNRHWPRLLQYLRELEEQTDWSPDGRGIRLANIGGRGPVAREPRDPGLLSIVIDPDYLS